MTAEIKQLFIDKLMENNQGFGMNFDSFVMASGVNLQNLLWMKLSALPVSQEDYCMAIFYVNKIVSEYQKMMNRLFTEESLSGLADQVADDFNSQYESCFIKDFEERCANNGFILPVEQHYYDLLMKLRNNQ